MEPSVLIPTGPTQIAIKFLIDTGAQISVLNEQEAKYLGILSSQKKIKIHGVTGAPGLCHLTQRKLWLPGDKYSTTVQVALNPYPGNILGFDVLGSKKWHLPDGSLRQ